MPERFELIVDYKGSRRPPNLKSISGQNPSLWDQYEWQVLTYAELRAKQIGSKPVAAGIVIYVNELLPLEGDLFDLEREVSGFTQKNGTKLSMTNRWIQRLSNRGVAPPRWRPTTPGRSRNP